MEEYVKTRYLVCGVSYVEGTSWDGDWGTEVDYCDEAETPLKVVAEYGAIKDVIGSGKYPCYTVYRIERNGDLTEITASEN